MAWLSGHFYVFAQNAAFTYQGQLVSGGSPANGSYDLKFSLFNTNNSGSLIAGPVTNSATTVSNGLFIATLNYGSALFNSTNYWLEIGVRTNGLGTFTTLMPRQAITPVPYALNVVTGAISAAQLKTTNAPSAGQTLMWNGTNLYWGTPAGAALRHNECRAAPFEIPEIFSTRFGNGRILATTKFGWLDSICPIGQLQFR